MAFVKEFMTLFAGLDDAYGTYDHNTTGKSPLKGGKVEIKKSARTVRGEVTADLWAQHLAGKSSLGVIPIRADGTCSWACIDIDQYDINPSQIAEKIEQNGMPLVPCRTKSGGLHLFMFLASPTPASDVQSMMKEFAGVLGFGGSEIFPKQTQILAERGDVGNWLNMPYFGGDKTDRYGIKKTGAGMTMAEFVAAAFAVRTELSSIKVEEDASPSDFSDGPPCLQYLASVGFAPGTRNAGLFALGTFAKKKHGEGWQAKLEEFNRQFMTPPLPSDEVQEVLKNLTKKTYEYKCKDAPINAHCNSTLCRTRRFGVGGGSTKYPVIESLSMLKTEPPIWFMDITGKRVELNIDQLYSYQKFQQCAMVQLQVVFQVLKQQTWLEMVGLAMDSLIVIDAPPEASVRGHFEELLAEFCINRYRAETKEELLAGKPWEDEVKRRHYFRLQDLMDHLVRVKFPWSQSRNKVASVVMELGGGKEQFMIKGRLTRVMWVSSKLFDPDPPVELPATTGTPI